MTHRIKVWDLPTRVFHWSLVALVAAGTITGLLTQEWWMGLHILAGYGVVALIVFRFVWGFLGSQYSRFEHFTFGPREIGEHLREILFLHPRRHIGHNPTGAAMIFVLGLILIGITLSGFLVLGGEEKQGPLAGLASYAFGSQAKEWHETLVYLLLALVAGHVVGVIVESRLLKENLVLSMITGDKDLPDDLPRPTVPARPVAAAGVLLAVVGIAAAGVVALYTLAPIRSPATAKNAAYDKECGACHYAFHPSLMPARKWAALLADLSNHFGDDASLPPAVTNEISAWLAANSGEHWDTEAANWFLEEDPSEPLRITATDNWRAKHAQIGAEVFARKSIGGRTNCAACHADFASGQFDDQAIDIPEE
jgi:cytochrome b